MTPDYFLVLFCCKFQLGPELRKELAKIFQITRGW